MITKEDFSIWKEMDVTKAFFNTVLEKREGLKELLIKQIQEDTDRALVISGYCQAFEDVLNTDLMDVVEYD